MLDAENQTARRTVTVAGFPGAPTDADPLYRLWVKVRAAYERAGSPTLRRLAEDARRVRAERLDPTTPQVHGPSHTSVGHLLNAERVLSWGLTEPVLLALGADVDDIEPLWSAAYRVRRAPTQALRIALATASTSPDRENRRSTDAASSVDAPDLAHLQPLEAARTGRGISRRTGALRERPSVLVSTLPRVPELEEGLEELRRRRSGPQKTLTAVEVAELGELLEERDYRRRLAQHKRDTAPITGPGSGIYNMANASSRDRLPERTSRLEWCINHNVLLNDSLCFLCSRPICSRCKTHATVQVNSHLIFHENRGCYDCAAEFERPLTTGTADCARELDLTPRKVREILREVYGISLRHYARQTDRTWLKRTQLTDWEHARLLRYVRDGETAAHPTPSTPGRLGFARHARMLGPRRGPDDVPHTNPVEQAETSASSIGGADLARPVAATRRQPRPAAARSTDGPMMPRSWNPHTGFRY